MMKSYLNCGVLTTLSWHVTNCSPMPSIWPSSIGVPG